MQNAQNTNEKHVDGVAAIFEICLKSLSYEVWLDG